MWKASLHITETRTTLVVKIAILVAATVAFFSQDLTVIFMDALQDEAMSYILTIPFIFTYLVYRKRKMLRAVIPPESTNQPKQTQHLASISGILLCATAVILYWHGSYTFTPLEYHVLALPVFAAGLTLVLFNPQTLRQLAFPIAFLIFLMPPPSEILFGLGSTLSVFSSEASNTLVNMLGISSTISSEYGNPAIVITRPDQTTIGFIVDIACSGIYSLIGFLVFAAFIAYAIRDKTWKKTTVLFIGLPLIYLVNIIRLAIILLIGYQYGEQLALEAFHLIGGLTIIFLGTLLLLTIAEKVFKTQIFTKPLKPTGCENCNPKPYDPTESFCFYCGKLLKYPQIKLRRQDMAKITAIAAAVTFLLLIHAPVFALTEGPAQITIQTPAGEQGNTLILPQIQGYTLQFVYRDKHFEEVARQDASLLYAYMPLNKTEDPIFVGIEIASATTTLHRWETCLITWPQTLGYQPKVTQLDLKDTQILQNPPIIARYFAFQYTKYNQTQLVLYWYETSTFITNSTSQQKHVKISLITYPETPQNITEEENTLFPFAVAIANHWQPIKTWTQIALLISKNGATLTTATTTLLACIVIFHVVGKMKTKKANANAYHKLSKPNKQLIAILHETEKTTTPTLNAVAIQYQKRIGESVPKEKLLQKLLEAEKMGLIKGSIANEKDEPIQVWKTQILFDKA